MKYLVTAIALAIAAPAAAQTAPAQPHQDHAQHQQHGQGQHQGHAQQGQAQHGQHQGHGGQDGCCADRNGNGRMDCCEGMAQPPQPAAQPQRHDAH